MSKKNIINKIIILMIIFLIISVVDITESYAGVSFSQTSVSITTGSSKGVTITGNDAIGNINVSSSNADIATATISSNWIENNSLTITISGKNAGNATVYVTGVVSDSAGSETNINTSISVSVTSNSSSGEGSSSSGGGSSSTGSNSITSLKVGDKTYSNPNQDITLSSVDADTDSITIVPTTTNGASYTINGGSSKTVALKTGTNVISIAVSNGKTYKVRITRLAKEEEVQPNIIDEQTEQKENKEEEQVDNKLILSSLKVKDFELTPGFDSNVYSYTINVNMQEKDVNKLDIDAIPNAADAIVEIIGNENLVEGENIITILVKSASGEESAVYQIIVNKNDASSEIVSNSIIDKIGFLSDLTPLQRNLLLGFAGFILLLVIIVIIVLIRKEKKNAQIQYDGINNEAEVEESDEIQIDQKVEEIEEADENEQINQEKTEDIKVVENDKTSLNEEKAALMDEFFSYNKEFEENKLEKGNKKEKRKGKTKGKGKHF